MATPISGLLVMPSRQAVVDATGESEEVQFNIPRGLAIGITKIDIDQILGDLDGAAVEIGTIISFDGPRYASNAISTKALFEAEEVLDSSLFQAHAKVDNITTGATLEVHSKQITFEDPIFTGRNPGIARLVEGASGETFVSIYYKWFRISDAEFITLVTDLRS